MPSPDLQASCIGCKFRKQGRSGSKYKTQIGEFDRCRKAELYLSTVICGTRSRWFYDNGGICSQRKVEERIKDTVLWVRLYFKGREKDPIVVEEGKHEIFIEGIWLVRKVFGMADKFHAWQDRRREKRWIAAEAKRKAQILTHIVKELPRA